MLTRDQLWVANYECSSEALAPGPGVHARSMHPGLRLARQTVLVERQMTESREGLGQDFGLIETTFALTCRMQRNRNNHIGVSQRCVSLRLEQVPLEASRQVRAPLQLEDRRAQGAIVSSTGARVRERVVIAPAAADSFASVVTHRGRTQRAAFPTERFITAKQRRIVPASRASNAIMARLDTCSTDGAGLGIDQCQGGVEGMTGQV